jgi:outer membrane protein insertion porin family
MLGPPSAYTSPPIGSGPPVYGGPSPAAAVGSNVGIAPSGRIFDEEPTRNVDIAATVQEAQTGRLMLGIGVNSSSGLTGTATIEEQNFDWRRIPTSLEDIRSGNAFRGAGQQFRIQAMPGTQVSQYSATFREPYLFDSLFSLSLNAQFYNRFYANWTEQRAGGSVGVGRQLTPDLQAMFRLRGENVVIYNPTYPTPQELSQVVGSNDLFTFKFDLIHDTRDSSFLASQGHYLDLSYEQAFGQFTYPRFMIDARQHFLLHQRADRSGRHTLTLMTQLGFSGSNTPIFENFFAGGYQTLRGFYFRGASPIDPTTQVVVGGDFMWVNTIEYMFPITPDDMFRGVVFCDYGTVEQQVALYSNSFRVSPGAGLRLTIPAMGPAPIALDFAAPVMFMHGDQIQTFSFFVGTQR